MAITSDRMELYKAAKHEVATFPEDCGMNLAEMWKAISKAHEDMTPSDQFWYVTCLRDYENR